MKRRATHMLSRLRILGVLVFPVISITASLIGLAVFYLGSREAAIWVCALTWGATIIMTPIAIRTLSRPQTRVMRDCNTNRQPL